MKMQPMTQISEYEAALADIKTTLGFVPGFLKNYPQAALPGAWQVFKNVQMNNQSAIPVRYKELLGLAVASEIPCRYCTFFHTEAGRRNGASDAERSEAIALAALGKQRATIIESSTQDEKSFREETDRVIEKLKADKKLSDAPIMPASRMLSSPEEAYGDIELTLGLVPTFIRQLQGEGVPGFWNQTRSLVLSSNTAIPAKYKDLILLGVSSQIPCTKCVYWDSEAARLNGASEAEIREAVSMASIVTHWSTVLNGSQTNEAAFRKDVLQVLDHVKSVNEKARHASNMPVNR